MSTLPDDAELVTRTLESAGFTIEQAEALIVEIQVIRDEFEMSRGEFQVARDELIERGNLATRDDLVTREEFDKLANMFTEFISSSTENLKAQIEVSQNLTGTIEYMEELVERHRKLADRVAVLESQFGLGGSYDD